MAANKMNRSDLGLYALMPLLSRGSSPDEVYFCILSLNIGHLVMASRVHEQLNCSRKSVLF